MTVSLYAHGPAKIEVGKFGMSLEEAKNTFLAMCEKFNLTPTKIIQKNHTITIRLPTTLGDDKDGLLSEVANIEDLHGDPPFVYSLVEEKIPEGEYVKTGWYND